MGLNFLGLGFSFGAKDQGLAKFQERVSEGFFQINESLGNLGTISESGFGRLETTLMNLNKTLELMAAHLNALPPLMDPTVEAALKLYDVNKDLNSSMTSGFDSLGSQFEAMGESAGKSLARWMLVLDWSKEGIQDKKRALTDLGTTALGMGKKFSIGIFDNLKKTGFMFKRRSEDIKKSQGLIVNGFDEIRTVVSKLDQILHVNKLQGFISAISLGTLGKISGALGGIGAEGMNLTTSLEGMAVSNVKSAKVTATNLGLTGAEMKKVASQASGMAIGLNISADSATQAIVAFNRQTELMGAVGISSASDLAKLTEVTGLSAKAFGEQLQQMQGLGLAKDEISGVISSFTSMGSATRDVSGALSSMPEILKLIQTKAALMGKNLSGAQMADFAKQTAALSAGLGKFGLAAEDARGISMELATAQVGAQKEFANLFAGVGSELPGFIRELAITAGDSDKAFELIKEGPSGMIKGLDAMVKNAKASGANMDDVLGFMRARLEQAGISNADMLVNFLSKGTDEAKKQIDVTHKATDSLAKLGKEGFSTGYTLAEAFDLAKESAVAHFRASGKASKTFLRDFTKSATQFNKILDETSKDGGPLGQFVDKLRDVHRLGTAGLLPKEMQGAGVLLGEIVRQLGPMLGLIGGAILFFPGLTAVLGPVISVLGLFAINLFKAKLAGEEWGAAFQTAFTETGKTLRKGIDYMVVAFKKLVEVAPAVLSTIGNAIRDAFNSIDWAKVGTTLLEGGKEALGFLFKGFLSLQGQANEVLSGIDFKKTFAGIFSAISQAASDIPIDDIIGFLHSFAEILIKRVDILVDAFSSLIATALPALAPMVGEAVKGLADLLVEAWPMLQGALIKLIDKLTGVVENLGPVLSSTIEKLVPFLLDALWTLLTDVVPFVVKALPKILDSLMGLAIGLIGVIQAVFVGLLKGIRDWIVKYFPEAALILDPLIGFIEGAYDVFKSVLTGIRKFITKTLTIVAKIFVKVFDLIFKDGAKTWKDLKTLMLGVWDAVKRAWGRAVNFFSGIFSSVHDIIVGTFDRVLLKISGVWEQIKATWNGAKTFFVDIFQNVWQGVQEPFDKLKGIVLGVWDEIQTQWGRASSFFGNLWSNIKNVVVASVHKIKDALDVALGPLSDLFEMIDGWVDKLFRHSIHHDIEDDMAQSVDAIDGMGGETVKALKGMSSGIFGVFEKSFAMLQKKTDSFVADELKHFKSFLNQLQQSFASAFLSISSYSSDLTTILSEDIGNTVAQLTQIKQAFQNLEASRSRAAVAAADAVREKAETVPMKIPPELQGLARAVNWPSWYTDPKTGMKKILTSEVEALRGQLSALERTETTVATSHAPTRREKVAAVQRLRRSADGTTSTSGNVQ